MRERERKIEKTIEWERERKNKKDEKVERE